MGLLQTMLRLSTRESLADAPMQRAFWQAYSNEMIDEITMADLPPSYQIGVDFDVSRAFAPEDLKGWPSQILIPEGDNDPVAKSGTREVHKTLYPQVRVHSLIWVSPVLP